MAMTAETCKTAIIVMFILTFVDAIVAGYYFHKGDNEGMFIPLAIGFVLLIITYALVEMRGNLVAGSKVEKY